MFYSRELVIGNFAFCSIEFRKATLTYKSALRSSRYTSHLSKTPQKRNRSRNIVWFSTVGLLWFPFRFNKRSSHVENAVTARNQNPARTRLSSYLLLESLSHILDCCCCCCCSSSSSFSSSYYYHFYYYYYHNY